MSRGSAWLRPKLSTQLVLGTVAVVVTVIWFASFFLNDSLARLFQQEGNHELQRVSSLMVVRLNEYDWTVDPPDEPEPADPDGPQLPAQVKKEPVPPPTPPLPFGREVLEGTEHVFVRILDPEGKSLLESEGFAKLLPPSNLPKLGRIGEPGWWQWCEADGTSGCHFIINRAIFNGGWVLTAWDIRYENRLLKKSQNLLWLTWGLATLLTAGFVAVVARRQLAPLKLLEAQAAVIRPGALVLNLDPDDLPRDLGSLAENLKQALARLEEAFSRLTTLNADVAHELRTPLHGMRLQVEGLLRDGDCPPAQAETLEGVIETLDHLAATLDQMLFLARSEDPSMALQAERLEVAALLKAAASPFESLAEERSVHLDVRSAENLELVADEKLVRRALHNLLANALNHAPEGSTVTLEALLEADQIVLQVRDEGEGIPEDFLLRLGQRFSRPDVSRSRASGGAGLGLAIVKNILRLHGGTLDISRAPEKGTLARLCFPSRPRT
ncbi:ATP-binding protein [Geothrix sp. PMB-07]|uniref:ATP-binding protein n=1 Tax=Geothrix sp. PMB-07 TaxID=3068640 RepID=UPI002742274D|nr:ATP-binding protein [Geothrix sp. PMB-07]WLT33278.1 ATP-binding protein [Geothrix sp. PMB-07]